MGRVAQSRRKLRFFLKGTKRSVPGDWMWLFIQTLAGYFVEAEWEANVGANTGFIPALASGRVVCHYHVCSSKQRKSVSGLPNVIDCREIARKYRWGLTVARHLRAAFFIETSQAFIFLPGKMGTRHLLGQTIKWNRGIWRKHRPIVLIQNHARFNEGPWFATLEGNGLIVNGGGSVTYHGNKLPWIRVFANEDPEAIVRWVVEIQGAHKQR